MNLKLIFGVFIILSISAISVTQDLTVILKNKKFVQNQIDCAMDRKPCDAIGKEIKGMFV